MSVKIVITESQLNRLYESMEIQMDIDPILQTKYDADSKTIITSYYVLDEKPNSYKVINPIEIEEKSSIYADGFVPYTLILKVTDLPKSQVKVLGEKNGYTIFELPYWLYRKNDDLKVRRIINQSKRPNAKTGRSDIYNLYDTDTLMKIVEPLGGDTRKMKTMSFYTQQKKESEK